MATGLVAGLPLAAQAGDELVRDFQTFVSQGEHRSGGKGDQQAQAWLAQILAQLGFSVERIGLPVMAIEDAGTEILTGPLSVNGFPQYMPPSSAVGARLEGPLALYDAAVPSGRLLVHEAEWPAGAYWTPALQQIAERAASLSALALIFTTTTPKGGIFVFNRDQSLPPLPIPVIAVSRADHRQLVMGAQNSSKAGLTISGRVVASETGLILGRKPGKGRAIVISTPLTGWFTCGSERGSGIALFLDLARKLARQMRPVVLMATGAHEIGHTGMKLALDKYAPDPASVELWLHLGAAIAAKTADGKAQIARIIAAGAPMMERTRTLFPADHAFIQEASANSPGETGEIIQHGQLNLIGFANANPSFHTPDDLGQETDFGLLAQIAENLMGFISKL